MTARILRAREPAGEVRAEGARLSEDATHVARIIADWQATGDDNDFAKNPRYLPSGVKTPGGQRTD